MYGSCRVVPLVNDAPLTKVEDIAPLTDQVNKRGEGGKTHLTTSHLEGILSRIVDVCWWREGRGGCKETARMSLGRVE